MYVKTPPTATREQALKAAAAAERAMERHACCKSQFKFKCFSCGGMINRGDKITRCNRATTGMSLRFRGACSQNGLTTEETVFYRPSTGENMWVHIGCIPCYWDSLPEDSKEYSRPKLLPICTDWGVKVYGEWEEWANDDEPWSIIELGLPPPDVPYFCKIKGYPKEKFMRDRIIRNVTRFQALWRGYIYKKALPIALQQKKKAGDPRFKKGDMVWCPFDIGTHKEGVYKGTITKIVWWNAGICSQWYYTVTYFIDADVRNYTEKTLIKRINTAKSLISLVKKNPGRTTITATSSGGPVVGEYYVYTNRFGKPVCNYGTDYNLLKNQPHDY